MYRSFTMQTLHYFARAQQEIRRTPLVGATAWRGSELRERREWLERLEAEDVHALDRALDRVRSTGKATAELSKHDFALGPLEARVASWRRELAQGRGFVVVRGFPVDRWSQSDSELVFWGLGLHLGLPGAQNAKGELLGHVIDERLDLSEKARLYRTRSEIRYHCDAADVVGLMCLAAAKNGGESRIASSVAVYNAVLERAPELVDTLYAPFPLDAHDAKGLTYMPIPPCRYAGGTLRTFYHSDYFRSGAERAMGLTPAQAELLDLYDELGASDELRLEMVLEPGDVQLLSNHTIMHGRGAYEDDGDGRRHLLRLWLSLDEPEPPLDRLRRLRARASLLSTMVRLRAAGLLRR